MDRRKNSIWRNLFWLLLTAAVTWAVFRNQDFRELGRQLAGVRWSYILLAMAITLLGHLSRAARWRMLLNATGHAVSLRDAFLALMAGYFVNMGIPRLGELTRCGSLQRLNGLPFLTGLGTVVTERAVDLLMLALVSLLFWLQAAEGLSDLFFEEIWHPALAWLAMHQGAAIAAAGLGLLGFAALLWMATRWSGRQGWMAWIGTFARDLWQGMRSVGTVRPVGLFVFHTLFIWASYTAAPILSLLALDMGGPDLLRTGFAVFVLGSLARTLPLPGGSLGAYHLIVSLGMLSLGYTREQGLTLATLNHGVQTLYYIVWGSLAFLAMAWLLRQRSEVAAVTASSTADDQSAE